MIRKLLIANRGEIAVRIIRACREIGNCNSGRLFLRQMRKVSIHSWQTKQSALARPLPHKAIWTWNRSSVQPWFPVRMPFIRLWLFFLKMPDLQNSVKNAASLCRPSIKSNPYAWQQTDCKKHNDSCRSSCSSGKWRSVDDIETGLKEAERIRLSCNHQGGSRRRREKVCVDKYAGRISGGLCNSSEKNPRSLLATVLCTSNILVVKPRHIEFQILADSQGNVIHLGERDCSIQRNHQKMIEESQVLQYPMSWEKKWATQQWAAAKAAGYVNAGTIESLLEPERKSSGLWEMNTRIQVEHPVTEGVTGIDLVKEQLKIASGMPLGITQDNVRIMGHAIECRINAENPQKNFRPSPGKIKGLHIFRGNGIRVDTCVLTAVRFRRTMIPCLPSLLSMQIIAGMPLQNAECTWGSDHWRNLIQTLTISMKF